MLLALQEKQFLWDWPELWEKVEGEEKKKNSCFALWFVHALELLMFVPELWHQHLSRVWHLFKEVWKLLWKIMALLHREHTFSVNVSGTLNYFLLLARVLIALMSCRGCERAALLILLTLTTMVYASQKLLDEQLNSHFLCALWKWNLFWVFQVSENHWVIQDKKCYLRWP